MYNNHQDQNGNNKQLKIKLTPKQRIRQHKNTFLWVGFGFIMFILILATSDMGGQIKTQTNTETQQEEQRSIQVANPTQNVKTEDRWLNNAQKKIDDQDEKVSSLSQENKQLQLKIEQLEEEKSLQDEKFARLSSQIENIQNAIAEKQQNNNNQNYNNNNSINGQNENHNNQQPSSITTITFDYNNDENTTNYNTTQAQTTFNTKEGYIPQGSYAPAKIISAVDAQVGIASQSNPKPVLIRLIGDAKSAIFKDKKLSVDITGCIITAGAIGELSSEKVYIKLSKMTCAKNKEEVTEVPIEGYVSAKGSNGIRGEVFMREGDLIGKSFLAGMVGSLGQAYSMSLAPPLTFGGGTTTQPAISADDAVKRGIGGGLGQSGNQISNYLIKRAEQYQPVISIPAGIEVEVVFLDGFYVDGRSKEKTTETATRKDDNINENV